MLYNFHTHTHFSHDSSARMEDLCDSAVRQDLAGILFSDHCDCEYEEAKNHIALFSDAYAEYLNTAGRYCDRLQCFFGIELGDPHYAPEFADRITAALPFDAVLLSVHAVRYPGADAPFSTIRFADLPQPFLEAYLEQYFEDVLFCVRRFDFDVLCHLTVPLRYIVLKYGRTVPIGPYLPKIREILREVIQRGKTLEINTSAVDEPNGFLMPGEDLIDLYLSLGGTSFSLGSDAHTPQNVSKGLVNAANLLLSKGIGSVDYYKNRQKNSYRIEKT